MKSPAPPPAASLTRHPTNRLPSAETARPLLAVLGTGFGAFNLIRKIGDGYDVTVVSPRNHFLFTPLLPSTTVGTVEFRSIIEPVRRARQHLRFLHARADGIDPTRGLIRCTGAVSGERFTVRYDTLVIAVGAISNSYNIPGVDRHALFLRELNDARILRQRIIQSFERANLPTVTTDERRRLLHFVVCGGGPTGVEFAAELHDFLTEDLQRSYPDLVPLARISIVEASHGLLSSFDEKLRHYAEELFHRQRIQVLRGSPVIRVTATEVRLKSGTALSYGLLLWSTGNGPTPLIRSLPFPKNRRGQLIVDATFRVTGTQNVYALGDCAVLADSPLPETAQVAQQQGKYLARSLNAIARGEAPGPFRYRHLGMLAYIGGNRALADLQNFKGRGRATWLFWRSAYLTRVVGIKNKVLVLFDWIKAQLFGRDISQF